MDLEVVPSSQVIEKWLGDFLVDADNIQGIYRNVDIDSLLFTYRTAINEERNFRNALSKKLQDSRWKETEGHGFIEYRRRFEKGEVADDRVDMPIFFSYEVVRIGFSAGRVVVAYVQADTSEDVRIFEKSGEGQWAKEVIWPQFEELLRQ
jgi:hypothetical protein